MTVKIVIFQAIIQRKVQEDRKKWLKVSQKIIWINFLGEIKANHLEIILEFMILEKVKAKVITTN